MSFEHPSEAIPLALFVLPPFRKETVALSTHNQIFLNLQLFFLDQKISMSNRIRIQIEYSCPHVSDTYPDSL